MSDWISVNDKLPELRMIKDTDEDYESEYYISEMVLVATNKGCKIAYYEVDDGDKTFWVGDCGENYTVTHWMPLPELPKEG